MLALRWNDPDCTSQVHIDLVIPLRRVIEMYIFGVDACLQLHDTR